MEYRPRSLGALESLTILLIDFLPQKQKQKLNNFEKNKKKMEDGNSLSFMYPPVHKRTQLKIFRYGKRIFGDGVKDIFTSSRKVRKCLVIICWFVSIFY